MVHPSYVFTRPQPDSVSFDDAQLKVRHVIRKYNDEFYLMTFNENATRPTSQICTSFAEAVGKLQPPIDPRDLVLLNQKDPIFIQVREEWK